MDQIIQINLLKIKFDYFLVKNEFDHFVNEKLKKMFPLKVNIESKENQVLN